MTQPRSIGRVYLFALLGWTFDFYDLVLLGFLMDPVARDMGLSQSSKAWLLGVALGSSGIGGIVAGALADRIGKRTMLAWTVLIYSAGSLVCGLAPGLWAFVLGRAIVGLGVGGEWAIGHGMLAESVAPQKRGRWAAALQSGEPIGVALAATVGYLVLPVVGWRWVLVGSSVTALVALAARRSVHLPDEPAGARVSLRVLAGSKLAPRLGAAWVLGVFKLGTYWTCYTWLPSFLLHEMHQAVARSLMWMLTAQTGQLLGMVTFGIVSDRFGRRPAFTAYSVLTACALAPLAFAWQSLSPPLFWTAMFALGVGSGCTAGFGALLAELFPTEVRGAAMGATYNLARAAQLLAPVIVQAAVMRAGLAGGLGVPIVLALATASWVWVLPETRGIVLPTLGSQR
jgi:MFS family permease